jgi:hypothetical protein
MLEALRVKKDKAYVKYVSKVTSARLELRFGTRPCSSPKEWRNKLDRQQQLVERRPKNCCWTLQICDHTVYHEQRNSNIYSARFVSPKKYKNKPSRCNRIKIYRVRARRQVCVCACVRVCTQHNNKSSYINSWARIHSVYGNG